MSERSEKQRRLESQLSDLGAELSVLKGLLMHPGWSMYLQMSEEQQRARKGEVLFRPLTDSNSVYAQEFQKGEISGLALALVMPAAQVEHLEMQVKIIREQLENENAIEKRVAEAGAGSRVDTKQWFGGDNSGGTSSK